MAEEPRVFDVDSKEIDRYARAITRILERGDAAGSEDRERAVNTYGTAFQLLVMRRGAEYGRALGMAAGDLAIVMSESGEDMRALVAGEIADIHERVCLAEEEAARAAAEAAAAEEGSGEDQEPSSQA